MSGIRRLAIVNRGESAMRCLAAVDELGYDFGEPVTTIALYTDPDATSLFVRQADEAVPLGPALIADPDGGRQSAYLDIDNVMTALARARADSVWPGWGFVAESADFAARCEEAGITFVGPSSDVIRLLGDKMRAKQLAERLGIPVVPWSGGPVHDSHSAQVAAGMLGYPVLVKAAAGGGGRGMRLVESESAMPTAFGSAQREAEVAFGDPTVFIERKLDGVRHVEVQVIADGQGTVWAAGIRDCSIQRRYQKVIEESGSTKVGPVAEAALRDAAVRLCRAVGYRSAGTVEFLVDPEREEFYFLEVNARIQVEHPVTEAITGLDLVEEQIAIAEGRPLRVRREDVAFAGHAIECRINAEDPRRGFLPSPGTITGAVFPAGTGVRVDTHVQAGATVPPHYDSLLAKVIGHGADRGEALATLRGAVDRCAVDGVVTNLDMHRALLADAEFAKGGVDTGYLGRFLDG